MLIVYPKTLSIPQSLRFHHTKDKLDKKVFWKVYVRRSKVPNIRTLYARCYRVLHQIPTLYLLFQQKKVQNPGCHHVANHVTKLERAN